MSDVLKKQTLFMFVGLPGSGKTYFARQLSEKLGTAMVSGERIRHELFEKPSYTLDEEGVVKHMMLFMTEEFLKAGLSVVYDTNLLSRADRHQLRNYVRSLKAEPILIWQQVDPTTSFNRVSKRNPERSEDDKYSSSMSKDLFVKMSKDLQTPKGEDSIVVSGKHSFNGQYQTVLRGLLERQLVSASHAKVARELPSPGLINLVASHQGRVDHTRRNINID